MRLQLPFPLGPAAGVRADAEHEIARLLLIRRQFRQNSQRGFSVSRIGAGLDMPLNPPVAVPFDNRQRNGNLLPGGKRITHLKRHLLSVEMNHGPLQDKGDGFSGRVADLQLRHFSG